MGHSGSRIRLHDVEVEGDRSLVCRFETSPDLRRLLEAVPFRATYEGSLRDVPRGIAAIPFVGVMAPVAWFFGATLDVPVLDRRYAESMASVSAAFRSRYPEVSRWGCLLPRELTDTPHAGCRKAALFSSGIDSTTTALRHLREDPLLVSVRGSDVGIREDAKWRQVDATHAASAACLGLRRTTVEASFLAVLRQWALDLYCPARLSRSWYVEVNYAQVLLGLCAPVTWREGADTLYIASTFLPECAVRDGSHAEIDDAVCWSGTRVVHDAGRESRQDKVDRLATLIRGPYPRMQFYVCVETPSGVNCSVCEKCCRTIAGLALNGIDPSRHGFRPPPGIQARIRRALARDRWGPVASVFWRDIQASLPRHRDSALEEWREFFGWLEAFRFARLEPDRGKRPLQTLRRRILRWLPFPVAERLSNRRRGRADGPRIA